MQKAEDITVADVARYFVLLESEKPRFMSERQTLLGWRRLPDAQLLTKMRWWLHNRDDTNPVLVWTVGDRRRHIRRWTLHEVALDEIYTCGLNPRMKQDLDNVDGNLVSFTREAAHKYAEFRDQPILPELSRLIVVLHSQPGRRGTAELIDGAHRAVTMIRSRVLTAHCFAAELQNGP